MRGLLFSALVAFCPVLAIAADAPPLSAQDQYKPILIDGDNMPRALGKQIEHLSLQAVIDNHLEPIPYQIDEYNTGGALYFADMEVPLDGTAGVLDPNDKLLFLYKDAGPRRTLQQRSDGKILSEIELTDAKGAHRYVYLIDGSRLRSEEQYVRYSAEQARVETDFYSLIYSKKNQIDWEDFAFNGFAGEMPLDSMRLRMTGGLITNMNTVTLNNENFIAKPVGEHIGPIRTTSQMKVTMWLLGLPLLDVSYQVHHYPKSMLYDVRVMMPEVRRKALASPKLSISLDANNLRNATFQSAKGPLKPAIVDGVMSPEEVALTQGQIQIDNNWIWLSTHRKFDVLAFFDYIGDTEEPLYLVYNDDADRADPPERFKGAMPEAGYRINHFPDSGFFGFTVSTFLSDGWTGNPLQFTQAVRSQPVVRVVSVAD